jgi:capsular polysaccharide biosynthesis protein
MNVPPLPTFDDEIDLRAIIKTLWKARKSIFITALAIAVMAFVASFLLLPRKYQATAYVFVGKPVVSYIQDLGLTIEPTLPDIKAVVDLAAAPGLLDDISADPEIIAAFGDEEFTLAKMVDALDMGKDQIRLQVIDTDPQRAALIANRWADKVTTVVNDSYGIGAVMKDLDPQVLKSQQDYEKAQIALENGLSKNPVEVLNTQLGRKQTDLGCVLASVSQTTRVLDDLETLEQGVSSMPAESLISLGDWIALTSLRQRSLTSQPCQSGVADFVVQIDSASFERSTVSTALASIAQMRAGLQMQLNRLQDEKSLLERELPELRKDFENAQAQLNVITLKRDQARDIRDALSQQQQRVSTVLAQSAKVAEISLPALPPQNALSRNAFVNTVAAGVLGLILAIFLTLATDWWRNNMGAEK